MSCYRLAVGQKLDVNLPGPKDVVDVLAPRMNASMRPSGERAGCVCGVGEVGEWNVTVVVTGSAG